MGNICKNQTPCAAGANRKTLGTSSNNRHAFEGSCVEPATTDASLPPWPAAVGMRCASVRSARLADRGRRFGILTVVATGCEQDDVGPAGYLSRSGGDVALDWSQQVLRMVDPPSRDLTTLSERVHHRRWA
jgi:hypothetical protein